jgi:phage antirepressor YoqD-like protein
LTASSLGDLVGQVIGNSGNNTPPPAAGPNTNDNNGKGKKDKKNGREQNKKQNTTKALDALEIIRSKCLELFVDQVGEPYAAIKVRDHIETIAIRSNRFKDWIVKAYYDYRKEQQEKLLDSENFDGQEEYSTIGDTMLSSSPLLNNEDATKIQTIIKLEPEGLRNERVLEVRVAGNVDSDTDANDDDNIIWYDLTNRDWEIVKITKHGWHIEKHGFLSSSSFSSSLPTILFKRYKNQLRQVYPAKEYLQDIFSQFMDLTNLPKNDKENRILAEVYTIALFIPQDIPKTVLIPYGEQGAAKSTFQEFIKMLVDPCGALTLSFPKEVAELVQQLSHNFIAYYDNVSEIPPWISDVLCRAVTGSGFSKRILYSDDDDFIYRFRRCVGFNGINVAATRPDLLERGLILHLKAIPEEKKRKLKHLWKQYERIKPQVLGFIFDTLVQVLNRLKEVQLTKYPRMADWAEVCEVISRCLGYPKNAFLDAYYKNMTRQNEHALEASAIATAIIKLMEKQDSWKGSASQLLEELKQIAEGLSINTKINLWPKAPNALSRKLNEVRTNLSKVGIDIERPIDTATNTRLVEIRKISPECPVSPEDPNQAQLQLENPGDINSISPDISR